MTPPWTQFSESFASTKSIFLFLLSILVVLLCTTYPCQTNATQFGNNETDREALLAFRAKISSDPFGFLTSWNNSVHFCNWRGVTCDQRVQRVVTLSIKDQMLSGSISPYIGNLSFLRNLSLANNSFTHEIPPQLGRLHMLEYLRLLNNSFSGDIPANLSACTNLKTIYFAHNNLGGKIPVELGSLRKLKYLNFYGNHLMGGIPPSFGNLTALVWLSVGVNDLVGSIPSALGQLKNLEFLYLDENQFSDVIPITIYNISSLTVLAFAVNQINGSLPLDMGITLPNLEFFNVANNSLTGSIPTSISNLSNLWYLEVQRNQLTGKMPTFDKLSKLLHLSVSFNRLGSGHKSDLSFISTLRNATDLKSLSLSINNFGGTLPESLGNLSTKLSELYLGFNPITGNLPDSIGNLVSLEVLSLRRNQFTGNIPSYIWKLQSLKYLDLGENKFSGKVSPFVGNLSLLLQLQLDKNDLEGQIPPSVGNCKQLLFLNLSGNNLNGTMPQQIFDLSSLSAYLDLSYNRFTGPVPTEISNLKNLGELYINNNMLSGIIPSSLGSCASMEYLYMGGNSFQGNIPSSLSDLRSIRELDLSLNNLSGPIPNFLGSLNLRYLNLSFNDFEGALPSEGIFKNSSVFSVNGNNRLCSGLPELKLPLCNVKRLKKRMSTLTTRIILIPTALGLLGFTTALGFLLCCWLRKKKKEPLSSSAEYSSLVRISYQSLVNATNGFIYSNLIGMGSYGSVYRGVLDDGNVIAVKVLDLHRHGALRSFVAECEALRNIRHRNLVRVLSACSGIDYQGNDFKAVVYELMVNGSLEDWLHSVLPAPIDAEPMQILNLLQRLNIAIDVASALEYLHNQCHTPIVHCDIKPSNVLLDSEMTAHVGDFGLARILILEDTNSFNTNQSSSFAIKGTVGYAPPEYGMGSEVSVYGDIYSYGILVLEMFIGKRPTDDIFNGSLNLRNFAKLAFPDRVMEIVDPMLFRQGGRGNTSTTHDDMYNQSSIRCQNVRECLTSILRIGITCSLESPGERMDICSVVNQLRNIRDSLLKA